MKRKHTLIFIFFLIIAILCTYLFLSLEYHGLTTVAIFLLWAVIIIVGIAYMLFSRYQQQMADILILQQASVSALVDLAEMHDKDVTGAHLHRLGFYAEILTQDLGLPVELQKNIIKTIALHDIGKIAIPDQILNKPGPLDYSEWEIVQKHPERGYKVLQSITEDIAVSDPEIIQYLITAQEITLSHHERWDGSGYPQGLKGEEIPISARIAAVCDVYDSLRSSRPYKRPFSHQEAVAIINSGKGTHFDPKLVDSFMRMAHHFAVVWEQHGEATT